MKGGQRLVGSRVFVMSAYSFCSLFPLFSMYCLVLVDVPLTYAPPPGLIDMYANQYQSNHQHI